MVEIKRTYLSGALHSRSNLQGGEYDQFRLYAGARSRTYPWMVERYEHLMQEIPGLRAVLCG